MKELQDYGAEYEPDFQLSNLSKDALLRLIGNCQRIFVGTLTMSTGVIKVKGDPVSFFNLIPLLSTRIISKDTS